MTTRQAGGIALVLIVISVFLLVIFRTIELVQDHGSLAELRELQENAVREAAKSRRQFDALAAGVAELAAQGDSAAKAVVDEMRREGVVLPAPKR